MHQISIALTGLGLLLLPLLATAQTNTTQRQAWIRGTLVDEQKAPVPFGTVALLRTADSVLVTGVVADEAGVFAVPTRPG